MTHLKFLNWSKSPALFLQVNYSIELAQHDLEKHWSGEFSCPLSEFFFYHCCEPDSPSYGGSQQNEETGGFLSKTTTHMCFWQNREVFSLPGRRGILYLQPSCRQEFEREAKRLFSRLSGPFERPLRQATALIIAHIGYTSIKILRGLLVIFLYLIWISLCSSLFWEL